MGLSMENFNIMRGSLKNLIFMGGKKTERNYLKKEGLDNFHI